jgi:hypothetical protein
MINLAREMEGITVPITKEAKDGIQAFFDELLASRKTLTYDEIVEIGRSFWDEFTELTNSICSEQLQDEFFDDEELVIEVEKPVTDALSDFLDDHARAKQGLSTFLDPFVLLGVYADIAKLRTELNVIRSRVWDELIYGDYYEVFCDDDGFEKPYPFEYEGELLVG